MTKYISLVALILLGFTTNAQKKDTGNIRKPPINSPAVLTKTSSTTVLTQSVPVTNTQEKPKSPNGSSTQPNGSATAALTDADYFLAVAKVTVKTAGDNKEPNSKVNIRVYPASGDNNWQRGYLQEAVTDEFKVWSSREFTLPRAGNFDQSFNSLANYKQAGVMVDVLYNTAGNGPFFLTDAWKIDGITAVLEFKDKNGNPHPTMGSKTIFFPGVYLDFLKWQVFCKTDEYFNSLTPNISKRQ